MIEKPFGYPRQARLLTAKDFRTVFEQTSAKAPTPEILLLATDSNCPRLGFIIAKKSVKHATDRNRIKRLAKEYFRLHRSSMPAIDIVFMARKGITELTDSQLKQLIAKQFEKISKRAQKPR